MDFFTARNDEYVCERVAKSKKPVLHHSCFMIAAASQHPVVLSQWGQQLNSSKLGPKEEGDDIVLTCRVVGGFGPATLIVVSIHKLEHEHIKRKYREDRDITQPMNAIVIVIVFLSQSSWFSNFSTALYHAANGNTKDATSQQMHRC
uniref:Uncharacterized protein n=1 Tax=Anopheles farauti TaxID=69004 RepID=A0A182R0P9_9DIPT